MPFSHPGIRQYRSLYSRRAFSREEALKVVEEFKSLEVPILGGDVYALVEGTFNPNYDNWFYDPLPNEEQFEFLSRSLNKAALYIDSYQTKDPENIFLY